MLDTLWSSALAQGDAAGAAMAGAEERFARPVSANVTRLAGLVTTVVGSVGGGAAEEDVLTLARGESETWRLRPDARSLAEEGKSHRVRVLVGSQALVGAVVIGNQAPSRILHRAIAQGVDLGPIRSSLDGDPAIALARLLELCEDRVGDEAPRG